MAAPESPETALEALIGRIADEFTRRHQRGEGPRLEDYTDRYPELAGLLGDILPAIQAISPKPCAALAETPSPDETFGKPGSVAAPARLADYELLAEIGRGGMGVVYKARHRTLDRLVALKLLRSRDTADLERFRHEAQVVARLQHPNIVQIFDVQEADGQPFLALEHVAGGSLAERIKGEPQAPRAAAALVETLARAMAAAHERGLVHRDLKPGNILLAPIPKLESRHPHRVLSDFTPKVTDFGLAKRLDVDAGQTQSGAIVGTPGYMAPEQAVGGADVGPAADIFALGAILYELIAGRPPFKGPSVLETLELVRHAEPTPPSQLQPGCPRDLETICLTCLHKEPARRYGGATLLADDLRRFRAGEPIHARPVGKLERCAKWLRRRPAVAASLFLGTLAMLAVVALTVRLIHSWELQDANDRLAEAIGAKEVALADARQARGAAEQNHQEADEARAKLKAALERERALHYVHSIGLAQREWQANRIAEARRILEACPPDLRHWEWDYLHRQCRHELTALHGHVGAITALAVSPDSKLIAAASRTVVIGAAPASDLKIWNADNGKLVHELHGPQSGVYGIAFSPDGAVLASSSQDNTIRFWDPKDGRELHRITGPTAFGRIAFSPDGTRLAAIAGQHIRIFEVATGVELFALTGHTKLVHGLAYSRDGHRLITGGADGLVKVWDLASKQALQTCTGHTGAIVSVAFSPDEEQIVSCGSGGVAGTVRGEVRVWNARNGKQTPLNLAFPFFISAAAFTSDAAQIACATADGRVLFVDARTGKSSFALRGHDGAVYRLTFTADAGRIITGGADHTIRIWPVRNPEFLDVPGLRPEITAMAFSADGKCLAFSIPPAAGGGRSRRGELRIIGTRTADTLLEAEHDSRVAALTFSADQRLLAVADDDAVRLWDVPSRQVCTTVSERHVVGLCFSPDGQYFATATRHPSVELRPDLGLFPMPRLFDPKKPPPPPPTPAIKIWRTDGQCEHTLDGHISVAFAPDGRGVAGARGNQVVIWDVVTGKERRVFRGLQDPILRVGFGDRGRLLSASTHRQVMVWEADTGRPVATMDGFQGPASVTSDARRVVSRHGGTVKWWELGLGHELVTLTIPESMLRSLVLSPDGRQLAAAGHDKLILWHAEPR